MVPYGPIVLYDEFGPRCKAAYATLDILKRAPGAVPPFLFFLHADQHGASKYEAAEVF